MWESWQKYEKVVVNGKIYAKVGERLYTKHAVDRMQPSRRRFGVNVELAGGGRGNYGRSIAPHYIEMVILSTKAVYNPEKETYSHSSGSIEVILNADGAVVTVMTYK
ncbi:MAG: hypothetical protein LBE35_11645 [Clostridiales bacterium]|nr:hypothetical protein [Clostridiales bacterium]